MVVPGGQLPPAGGAGGGEPDALREAVRAEDVATHSRQEVIAWGSGSINLDIGGERHLTFHPDGVNRLHADWAHDSGERGAGGRDSGAAGYGRVLGGRISG